MQHTQNGRGDRPASAAAPARYGHRMHMIVMWFVVGTLASIPSVTAQAPKKTIPKEAAVTLRTKDGVLVRCRYFAGIEGKKSVPVILVHGWEGDSSQYAALARGLQKSYGCAVVVPDLRGHGGSTRRQLPGRETMVEIRQERMRFNDIRAMFRFDLEAVKKFLVEKHNEGQLNIELLCLVGTDMGAVVAANWVAQDWSWPVLPTYKQGQDVKAFVLVSPPETFKGVKLRQALLNSHPSVRGELSALIVYGRGNSSDARTATQLHRTLMRYHDPESRDVQLIAADSDLQGMKLLGDARARILPEIATFIQRELTSKRDQVPWEERLSPLGN